MLTFYALPISAYCTKVRIVLRMKNIAFEEQLPIGGSYNDPKWKAYLPPGSIPAIEHNGFKLFDSEAIVEYLNDLSPEPPLHSDELQTRARQRAIAQFHNTRLEPAVRQLFPIIKSIRSNPNSDQLDSARNGLCLQLKLLCEVAAFAPYVSGPQVSLADCGFPATIFMGKDMLDKLSVNLVIPSQIDRWLEKLLENEIICDEVQKNRAAVNLWMEQFV